MKRPRLENLNNEKFLRDAFVAEENEKLTRSSRRHRNLYLALFVAAILCLILARLIDRPLLSVLSLVLAMTAFIVMTKYDTRLFFLRLLQKRGHHDEEKDPTPE